MCSELRASLIHLGLMLARMLLQASHDPNAIAELLHHSPYHTDALLAMSELYRVGTDCVAGLTLRFDSALLLLDATNDYSCYLQSMGEQSQADDMLDRCLYAFEMAWHHSFSIATANCMLDPERKQNKGFLEALFRQLQVLTASCLALATCKQKVVNSVTSVPVHMSCQS
jgi:Transcriptional repressor TCF25